jgi:hypothetical protein
MSFKVPGFAAADLSVELVDPGTLALRRLFRHPKGEWEPPDPKYRNLRVDPPDGHKADYAILYTGDCLLAAAMECHVLSVDPLDAWTLNQDLESEYSVARYITGAPGLFLAIDSPNRVRLGLANLPIHTGPVYAAFQSVGLELFQRFGDLAHGLSWYSFHRHQAGRIYAIWHHRKDALGLKVEPPAVPLREDAEWAALIAGFDPDRLMKIQKPAS